MEKSGKLAGKELSAFRVRQTSSCLSCGNSFEGIKTKMYCSGACRTKASRKRKSENNTDQIDTTESGSSENTQEVILGNEITRLRRERGMRQIDLAARVGVTPSSLSKFESGSLVPSNSRLEQIATALDTDIDALRELKLQAPKRIVNPNQTITLQPGVTYIVSVVASPQVELKDYIPSDAPFHFSDYIPSETRTQP